MAGPSLSARPDDEGHVRRADLSGLENDGIVVHADLLCLGMRVMSTMRVWEAQTTMAMCTMVI